MRERLSTLTGDKDARLLIAMLALIALAVLLRFLGLGAAPYGLYQDEAINGLDALGVLGGEGALYFPANNGREPLYIYLAALSTGLLGPSALALRLPAALLGALTMPAVYLLGRAWFDRRTGLMAAGVLAGLLWHLHLSRIAFRAVALPLLIALALGAGAYGLRYGARRALVVGGAAYGLSFYTYLPARFTPLALLLVGLYAWRYHRDTLRRHGRALLLMGLAAAVTLLPFALLLLHDFDLVMGRSGQVGIWSPAIHGGDLPGALARHTLAALGMFTVRGDTIARHNLPGRPVFDPLLALAWLAGLGLLVARFRRSIPAAAVVIWLAVMLLPTILAEDAPHFLRAVGVLPVVVLPAAYALARLPWRRLPVLLLALSLAWTAADYWGRYLPAQETAFAFDAAATTLADEVSAYPRAVVDWRIWDRYPALAYLTAGAPPAVYYDDQTPPDPPAPPALLAAWPYEPQARLWQLVPRPAHVAVEVGPLARYAPDAEPFNLYIAYAVLRDVGAFEPLATFGDDIQLIDAASHCAGGFEQLRLVWRALRAPRAPYTAFIHAEDGRAFDAPPGTWAYPTDQWRAGDLFTQRVATDIPCVSAGNSLTLVIGLYNSVSGDRLAVGEADYFEWVIGYDA